MRRIAVMALIIVMLGFYVLYSFFTRRLPFVPVFGRSGDFSLVIVAAPDPGHKNRDRFWLLDTTAATALLLPAFIPTDFEVVEFLKNTCFGAIQGENESTLWIGLAASPYDMRPIYFYDRHNKKFCYRGKLPYTRLDFFSETVVSAVVCPQIGQPVMTQSTTKDTLVSPIYGAVSRVYRWDGNDFREIKPFVAISQLCAIEVLGQLSDNRWVLLIEKPQPAHNPNHKEWDTIERTGLKKIVVFDSASQTVLSAVDFTIKGVELHDILRRWRWCNRRWTVAQNGSVLVMWDTKRFRVHAWSLPTLEKRAELVVEGDLRMPQSTALSPDGRFFLVGVDRLVLIDLFAGSSITLDDTAAAFANAHDTLARLLPILGPTIQDRHYLENYPYIWRCYREVGWLDERRCAGVTYGGIMRTFDANTRKCLTEVDLWPPRQALCDEKVLTP